MNMKKIIAFTLTFILGLSIGIMATIYTAAPEEDDCIISYFDGLFVEMYEET